MFGSTWNDFVASNLRPTGGTAKQRMVVPYLWPNALQATEGAKHADGGSAGRFVV